MKISRLVVSAVSLAVSAAMLTLSIIDLIRSDEYSVSYTHLTLPTKLEV